MYDISAIIPSYNHGRYVLEAVQGVLHQSVGVREVIVVDDGSHDDSLTQLNSIDDKRVRVIARPFNSGGSSALNVGIQASASPLIAICNSDDIWEPQKIETQLTVFEKNPAIAAVFSDVTWIGPDGQEIENTTQYASVFRRKNRSHHAWLKRLVEKGNCLCHPSVMIRRKVYDKTGWYDNRLRQLPDYKMWLSMAKHFEFLVTEDKLVRFRLHENTSAPSPASSTRDRNEFADIIEDFFRKIDPKTFVIAFGSRLSPSDARFNNTVEKFLYLWSIENRSTLIFRAVAERLLMELLQTRSGERAWMAYGFTMPDFHIIRGISSPWISLRENADFTSDEKDIRQSIVDYPILRNQNSDKISIVPPSLRRKKITREIMRIGRQISSILNSKTVRN